MNTINDVGYIRQAMEKDDAPEKLIKAFERPVFIVGLFMYLNVILFVVPLIITIYRQGWVVFFKHPLSYLTFSFLILGSFILTFNSVITNSVIGRLFQAYLCDKFNSTLFSIRAELETIILGVFLVTIGDICFLLFQILSQFDLSAEGVFNPDTLIFLAAGIFLILFILCFGLPFDKQIENFADRQGQDFDENILKNHSVILSSLFSWIKNCFL